MNGVNNEKMNTPLVTGGAGAGQGMYLSNQKDATESATATQFGETFKQIQSKYGARPEKPREIKKQLGKDDFLRIMITQMKNQDPTKPFNADQMATQIAQFTTVEQLHNVNTNLTKMADNNKPLERMSMTGMIGKVVTVDRERFPHTEGQNESISFYLPKEAASMQIAIISETGEPILEKDLGPQKSGGGSFSWDGLKGNTLPAKSGTYMFRVQAKDTQGTPIETNTQSRARVIGVSFEGSEPVFLIGDAQRQDKITMRNVIKIETDPSAEIPGARPLPGSAGSAAAGPPGVPAPLEQPGASKPLSFFTFEKGVGSQTIGADEIPPEMQHALQKYGQAEKAAPAAAVAPAAAPPEEKGFPNGLSDPQQQYNLMKGGESE